MVIYGTALLSACLVVGLALGRALGFLMGVDVNVGGVGIAMLLLILVCDRLRSDSKLQPTSVQGIQYWNAVYIPIVVAMAASQDVAKAVNGGLAAIIAGVLVVVVCFALVPIIGHATTDDSIDTDTIASLPFERDSASAASKDESW